MAGLLQAPKPNRARRSHIQREKVYEMLKVQDQRPYRRGQRQPTAAELAAVPELLLRGAGRQVDTRA